LNAGLKKALGERPNMDIRVEIGGLKTKKDTVNAALKEFVERRKQKKIIALFGSMPNDEDYDYKKARA
jgi:hypothetical protein